MAVWNTQAPLTRLLAILTGLQASQNISTIYTGVPSSLAGGVCVYVSLGGQGVREFGSGGQVRRYQNYRVTACYRTDGDVADAEIIIAGFCDAFIGALYADRTIGGTLENLEVDASIADTPRYVTVAGDEYREFPIMVSGYQRNTYPAH